MRRDRPALVASDVDGTLIDDAEFIPEANKRAIWDLRASGTTFCLATGRPPRWIGPVVEQLGFASPAVCANGAVIVDSGTLEILESRLLDPVTLRRIDEVLADRLPVYGIAAERFGSDAVDDEFVASPDYAHAWINPDNVDVGHDEVLSAPAIKLLARSESMTSADMVAVLGDALDGVADVTYSTDLGLVEFAAPGVSKAAGLAAVAARLGIASGPRADGGSEWGSGPDGVPRTVVFGDMPNDLEMLAWADLGVAMGNADDRVKAAADEITATNNEAGVARVLRRWW